jgi:hypothetical protein
LFEEKLKRSFGVIFKSRDELSGGRKGAHKRGLANAGASYNGD